MGFTQKAQDLIKILNEKLFSEENKQLLSELLDELSTPQQPIMDGINITSVDLEGLPDEVLAQLNLSSSDYYDLALVNLINKMGGKASIDKLIIMLYKEKGEVADRTQLNARLYRMTKKEMLYLVPGRKGVYSTASSTVI